MSAPTGYRRFRAEGMTARQALWMARAVERAQRAGFDFYDEATTTTIIDGIEVRVRVVYDRDYDPFDNDVIGKVVERFRDFSDTPWPVHEPDLAVDERWAWQAPAGLAGGVRELAGYRRRQGMARGPAWVAAERDIRDEARRSIAGREAVGIIATTADGLGTDSLWGIELGDDALADLGWLWDEALLIAAEAVSERLAALARLVPHG